MELVEVRDYVKLIYPALTEGPARLFQSFEGVLYSFELQNTEIVRSVDPLLNVDFLVERMEVGSLVVYLLKKIFTPDDRVELIQPEIVGNVGTYLTETQERFVEAVATTRGRIIGNQSLEALGREFGEVAASSGVSKSRNFRPPNKFKIAQSLTELSDSTKLLGPNERLELPYKDRSAEFGHVRAEIDLKQLRIEMTQTTYVLEDRKMLMIKIADFLGKSKWRFKIAEKVFDVKILDEAWLDKFHSKTDIVTPGDSLDADIRQTDYLDGSGKIIDSEIVILKVHKIHAGAVQPDFAS